MTKKKIGPSKARATKTKRIRKPQNPLKPEAEIAFLKRRLELKENQVIKLNNYAKSINAEVEAREAKLDQEISNGKAQCQLDSILRKNLTNRLAESTREKLDLIEQLREAKVVLANRKSIQITAEDGATQILIHDDPYHIAEPRLRPGSLARSWRATMQHTPDTDDSDDDQG